ncbi:MAG: tyrosine-type recombinase/integrase [Methanotrichaceae archaeon]
MKSANTSINPHRSPIDDYLAPFVQNLELRGRAKVSVKSVRLTVRRYILWANQKGIDASKGREEDLLSYLTYLRAEGLRKTTLVQDFSCLSVWFAYLVKTRQLAQNPIPDIKNEYLKSYKREVRRRQLISVAEAAKIVASTIDTRNRAILLLLFKTGIRRNELVTLDIGDVDLEEQVITLKLRCKKDQKALFLNNKSFRLGNGGVDAVVSEAAMRVSLHDPKSDRFEDKFTPHCCRHWFTTHLRRAGMPREFIQELRGDLRKEAIDIYDHIDIKELRDSYLAHIPKLGV